MNASLENPGRASKEKARDEVDVPFGHFVRKLRLKADIEHFGNQSETV
ncbi:MAG: hypothetical protein WAZ27_00815 [Minisyncoccia bacterium]